MSKTPTTTNNNNPSPTRECRPRYHMTLAEYALYDLCRSWTDGGKKLLFFDGPKMANQFREGSKNNMYKLEASLVRHGWLVLEVDKSRRSNGHWSSRTYRVLNHDEWKANQGAKYYDRGLKEVLPRSPEGCPEIDAEGVVKTKPVNSEGTAGFSKTVEASSPKGNGPVHCETLASPLIEPSQSPNREKACRSQPVDEKHVEEKRVGPSPLSPTTQSPGRVADRMAAGSIPPVHLQGTAKKPVHPEGTAGEIVFDRTKERYVDERTRKPLDWADINARIAPNTYNGGSFFDPSGSNISLDEAQEKVMTA